MIEHKESTADIIGRNGRGSRYDSAVKAVFRNKEILALLLKGCVREFQNIHCKAISEKCLVDSCDFSVGGRRASFRNGIGEVQPLDTEIPGTKGRQGQMDLCFYVKEMDGDSADSWQMVDVEFQNAANPGYPLLKRANYYVASMMYMQYGRNFAESDYNNIVKATSIWLCPSHRENLAVRYCMSGELLAGEGRLAGESCDLMRIVKIHFNPAAELSPNPVIGMLQTLFSRSLSIDEKIRQLRDRYSINLKKTEEMNDMIDFSNFYIEMGIEEGKAEGLIEGANKTRSEITVRLLSTLRRTADTVARISSAVNFVLAETVSLEDLKGTLTDEEYAIVASRLNG